MHSPNFRGGGGGGKNSEKTYGERDLAKYSIDLLNLGFSRAKNILQTVPGTGDIYIHKNSLHVWIYSQSLWCHGTVRRIVVGHRKGSWRGWGSHKKFVAWLGVVAKNPLCTI